jgi:UDP-2,3-diacylglucosamine pyrophosphatase LpxH
MVVIKEFINLMNNGTKVIYITGNHDEVFRRYTDLELGNFVLTDKYVVDIDGKKAWFFHGDIFDLTTKGTARIIAKLGGKGYDLLILFNRGINKLLELLNKEKLSFSKKIKNSIKKAVTFINDFESTTADHAISNGYDYVVCGHIHLPQNRIIENDIGKVNYLNSGDWVENLTSLEYENNEWKIYHYEDDDFIDYHLDNEYHRDKIVFDIDSPKVNLLLRKII